MEAENKPKNPSAFPLEYADGDFQRGMTLRDYFANSAMQAMISNPQIVRPDESEKQFLQFTERAYRYADAMLKQREL